jgi:hypothetical protein
MHLPETQMPDLRTFILPQRAFLHSYRDQALPARRAALRSSRERFHAVAEPDTGHEAQLALLGLAGDAMQPIEDVGTMAGAIMDGFQGLPFYVRATTYEARQVNNFFAQLHKRAPDYFLRLCAFRLGDVSLHQLFGFEPPLTDEELSAFDNAERATAALLAEHLERMAEAWERYRRIFHAYKHASLVANPDDVDLLDEHGDVIEGLSVWARSKSDSTIGGHAAAPFASVAQDLSEMGELAIDAVAYLIDTRLSSFDFIDISADGSVRPKGAKGVPWEFWMRESDMSAHDLDLLARLGVVLAKAST